GRRRGDRVRINADGVNRAIKAAIRRHHLCNGANAAERLARRYSGLTVALVHRHLQSVLGPAPLDILYGLNARMWARAVVWPHRRSPMVAVQMGRLRRTCASLPETVFVRAAGRIVVDGLAGNCWYAQQTRERRCGEQGRRALPYELPEYTGCWVWAHGQIVGSRQRDCRRHSGRSATSGDPEWSSYLYEQIARSTGLTFSLPTCGMDLAILTEQKCVEAHIGIVMSTPLGAGSAAQPRTGTLVDQSQAHGEDMPNRLPVDPRRFHGNVRALVSASHSDSAKRPAVAPSRPRFS